MRRIGSPAQALSFRLQEKGSRNHVLRNQHGLFHLVCAKAGAGGEDLCLIQAPLPCWQPYALLVLVPAPKSTDNHTGERTGLLLLVAWFLGSCSPPRSAQENPILRHSLMESVPTHSCFSTPCFEQGGSKDPLTGSTCRYLTTVVDLDSTTGGPLTIAFRLKGCSPSQWSLPGLVVG